MDRRAIAVLLAGLFFPSLAFGQACPAALNEAKRLVLVTTETMDSTPATAQLFERASVNDTWRALGASEPAVVGRAGLAWAPMFRHLARPGEPVKVEGDKRAPAGVYPIGGTFGTAPPPSAKSCTAVTRSSGKATQPPVPFVGERQT